MRVIALCDGMRIEIPCGSGKQHMRWLGLTVAMRMQKEKYPHAFRVPQGIRSAPRQSGVGAESHLFKPRQVIADCLKDNDEVIVELRQGAAIPDDDDEARDWVEEAYGVNSNLMLCKFRWKSSGVPVSVRGDYLVAPRWQGIYPQKDYGGRFEIPVLVEDTGDPDNMYDIFAIRKGPPGSCHFKFIMEGGGEEVCKAQPETLTKDGTQHHCEFTWDVPIAPEPFPEIDSRPSTASSREGAQVDPRFEQDWEAMRLRWVESFMKVRVKDVLTEFYAILIDLFDSYAFMGLSLSSSQHTIGMDDWKHLLFNCGLLVGQPEGTLNWREACAWFEEAAGVREGAGKPYLAQRLTRAHYLELLMRTAGYAMCEKPRAKYVPDAGRPPMPLDEGLFRFITDILIPVMDFYDDDPVRKDAVQNQNLIIIQQGRPSIRSMYTFLSQPWPFCDYEKVVIPATFKFVFEFTMEKLSVEADGAAAAAADGEKKEGADAGEVKASSVDWVAALGGEERLSAEQLGCCIECFDNVILKVTENHPELPEHRALLFWEFFEVLMHLAREMASSLSLPLHEGLPAIVQTTLAVMALIDQGEAVLPDPECEGVEGGEEGGEGGEEAED